MSLTLAALALLAASAACGLSLAVALRVKRLLDPLTEQGVLTERQEIDVPLVGAVVPSAAGWVDLDGEEVQLPFGSSRPWVISFQSVGCAGCEQQLPRYKRYLENAGFGRDRVITVVVGEPHGMTRYQEELSSLAHVVAGEEQAREFLKELGVSAFPTYLVVGPDGRVTVSTKSSARLAAPVPAGG